MTLFITSFDNSPDDCLSQVTQMSNLDRFLFLIGGSLTAFILLLLIIISRRLRPFKRQRTKSLIIGIAVSDLLLVINWIVQATKPTKIDDEDFCKTIGAFGNFSALMNFLYNSSFSIHLLTVLHNTLTQDKILLRTPFHFINLTISIVSTYFSRNLIGKTLMGTCSIKSNCSDNLANYFVLAFSFAFCILGVLTHLYLKRNSPILSRIDTKRTQFLNHYLKYNFVCILVYFLIGTANILENLFVTPQIIKSGYSEYQWISSLSHLAKLCSPLMLTIIRFNDPQIKPDLLKKLCFWKRRRPNPDLERPIDDSKISESEDACFNLYDDIFINRKRQFAYTLLSCLLYHDQHRKTLGRLPVTKTANKSPENLFKHQEVFLIEDENIKTHLPHVKEDLERRNFSILSGTLKVYSPEIYGQVAHQDRNFFDISESFDFISNPDLLENILKMRDLLLFSKDKKLILKDVTDTEIETITSILEHSQKHFNQYPNSLISKIYGAYTYECPELDSKLNFILIKNTCGFPSEFVERAYNIKGSRYEREVLRGKTIKNNSELKGLVLKDIDFEKYEQKLFIKEELHKAFIDQIKRDTEFLRNAKIIDYSLMVFFVNKEEAKSEIDLYKDFTSQNKLASMENLNEPGLYYNMGIIDYFQPYNFKKKLERFVKKLKGVKYSIVQDTDTYSYKFIQFIVQIVEQNNTFTYNKKITVM